MRGNNRAGIAVDITNPELRRSGSHRLYYTPEQVAVVLQLNVETILRWLRSGKLSGVKLGRVYRISEDHLKKLLNETR
jgi:excisionase family DNA binding protein